MAMIDKGPGAAETRMMAQDAALSADRGVSPRSDPFPVRATRR
jgi:hypothetical protein